MNLVDTSATMTSHAEPDEDIQQLQFELNTLREEVNRNNRQIHDIQLRDMESIESMKYHLERKRNLNKRIKQLRSRILKYHVSRQGGAMKLDEWLAGLNIALSPDRPTVQKFVEDDTSFSKSQYYNDDDRLGGDLHGNLLDELSDRLDNLLRATNQSNDSNDLVSGETIACSSPTMTRSNDVNVQRSKTDTEIGFSQQQHHQQQPYTNKSVPPSIKPSSPSLTSTNIARKSASGFGTQPNPAKRLNYPANVEIRSIQTPPIHPNKRKTVTAFTTNHPLNRKQTKSMKHNKHGVGDFMVHGRNPASASLTRFNSSGQSQSTNKFSGLVWTVIIIASATALLYMYPSLFNCILLLKDGAEQTRDEVTRILDAIIVRAGGDPWLSGSETESDAESYEPPPPPPSSSSSWSSLASSQNVGQQEESIWRTIQEYARAAYRYVLYDFP